jgi:Region found in RelA / SpoT proteins
MAGWVKREYSKGEIDRMGALLIPWWSGPSGTPAPANLGDAWRVIENWRTSHGLPLNVFQAGLRSRARRVDHDIIVAQRMKRIISMMNKLHREPAMKLSQMQDLGGCRAILPDVGAVDALYGMYRGDEPLLQGEGSLKCYDYIRTPKDDGYRGIHIVGRYNARIASREPWNGQRIEIQLRSRLQHAFATTVETVTTFTREPLKFGAGPTKWRRFFSLMGSALAIREATSLVAGTPTNERELVKELREVTRTLKVRQRLNSPWQMCSFQATE